MFESSDADPGGIGDDDMVQKPEADGISGLPQPVCCPAVRFAWCQDATGMVVRDTEGRTPRGKRRGQHLSYWKRAPVRSALSEWPDPEHPPSLVANDHHQPLVSEPAEQLRGGLSPGGRARPTPT